MRKPRPNAARPNNRAPRSPILPTIRPTSKVCTKMLLAPVSIMAIDHFLGSVAFGVAATVPGITSSIGQSVELVRAPHVRGVSAVFMVLAFVNQLLWLAWGLLIADPGTIITTAMISVLTGLNLLWYVLRRLGLRAFFAPGEAVSRRASSAL